MVGVPSFNMFSITFNMFIYTSQSSSPYISQEAFLCASHRRYGPI